MYIFVEQDADQYRNQGKCGYQAPISANRAYRQEEKTFFLPPSEMQRLATARDDDQLGKKDALPSWAPLFFIIPYFASLLNRSIPISFALWSKMTNMPSTMTTAPSMMIPSRWALTKANWQTYPLNANK